MQARLILASLLVSGLATASPVGHDPTLPDEVGTGGRVVRYGAAQEFLAPLGEVSNIIFLNRCVGGCTITKTTTAADARTNMSPIPEGTAGQQFVLTEFAHGEANWQIVLACVRAVYAPYNVMVTDVDPGTSVIHHEAIVAGIDAEIGRSGSLGVGNVSPTCLPYDNGISFAFANAHGDMENLCWTVAQESGHTYGLDHVFKAPPEMGLSACTDPMTYTPGCGRKYFRNRDFRCGEFSDRACRCSGAQNSHVRLLDTFGPGTTPPTPTVAISVPQNGGMVVSTFSVFATADAERGLDSVQLWLNGHKWRELEGRRPDQQGGVYTLTTPASVPDGVIDIEVRGVNDLGTGYGSQMITVTKGAPCTTADTCLAGQRCDAGRCMWDPAAGELGDACTYDQFCLSEVCHDVCTEPCFTGVTGDCPMDFECVADSGTDGFCLPGGGGGGGCCSASDQSVGALLAQLGLAALVLAGGFRRRRRPSPASGA